jgi:hypothetical protein
MDLIQWVQLISENALQTVAQIEQLAQGTKQSSIKLLPILEQNQLNLNHTLAINSTKILFTVYALVAICIKRPQLLAAFFVSCLLFESSFFDVISESHLYLITFIIYSYVITCNQFNNKTKTACVIMCILCAIFAYDAAFYGVDGYYGATETVIYNNIERLFICCHVFIIATLFDIRAIGNNIRDFCSSIVRMSRHSVNFTIV